MLQVMENVPLGIEELSVRPREPSGLILGRGREPARNGG